jgi:hypothetical protein
VEGHMVGAAHPSASVVPVVLLLCLCCCCCCWLFEGS